MKFYAGVWSFFNGQLENSNQFITTLDVSSSLKFGTQFHGGYGTASFTVYAAEDRLMSWARLFLNAHVVVFDGLGRRTYEGFINNAVLQDTGLSVSCVGYYAKATDVTFESLYAPGASLTVSQVIQDCVALIPEWRQVTAFLRDATTVITTEELGDLSRRKVKDVIETVTKFGYSDADARPVYFGIWNNQVPKLMTELATNNVAYVDWFIRARLGSNQGRLDGYGYSTDGVYNKIYATYDDQGQGPSATLPAEDAVSQLRFGVREGFVENGSTPEGLTLANSLRDAALAAYKYPRQTLPLEVFGVAQNGAGQLDYPHRIRAGHTIRVLDVDPMIGVNGVSGGLRAHGFTGLVLGTEFDASTMTCRVDVGTTDTKLEVLLGRAGLSGGLS